MIYMEWIIFGLMVASWIISTRFFIRVLCMLSWYHLPNSVIYPTCRFLKFGRDERTKDKHWERIFRGHKCCGPVIEIIILLLVYWVGLYFTWILTFIPLVFGKYFSEWTLSSLVGITFGVFSGFVFAWTILVLWIVYPVIPTNNFSKNVVGVGVLSVLIGLMGIVVDILGPERIRELFLRLQESMISGNVVRILTAENLARVFGDVIGALIVVNIVLILIAGYKIGKIRSDIMPR